MADATYPHDTDFIDAVLKKIPIQSREINVNNKKNYLIFQHICKYLIHNPKLVKLAPWIDYPQFVNRYNAEKKKLAPNEKIKDYSVILQLDSPNNKELATFINDQFYHYKIFSGTLHDIYKDTLLAEIYKDPDNFKTYDAIESDLEIQEVFCNFIINFYEYLTYNKKTTTISRELYADAFSMIHKHDYNRDVHIPKFYEEHPEIRKLFKLICETFFFKIYNPTALKHPLPDNTITCGHKAVMNIINSARNTESNVCVIKSGTGTGKSTVLSMILFDNAILEKMLILSPRIQSVEDNSKYVAELCCTPHGKLVGFKHGDKDLSRSSQQLITFRTQESFLQQFIVLMWEDYYNSDNSSKKLYNFISEYSLIVLDEAHENTVVNEMIMYIFKYIKKILKTPDVKTKHGMNVVFTILSATINPHEYTNYIYNSVNNDYYVEIVGENNKIPEIFLDAPCDFIIPTAVSVIKNIIDSGKDDTWYNRDILAFVTGQKEIKLLQQALENAEWFDKNKFEILQIFKGQSQESEAAIKKPHSENTIMRKIQIGTNKAETGITFPNTKYVIDSGYRKMSFYDFRINCNSELIAAISRNNALQRKGRVGRKIGNPGVVYYLYTKEFFKSLAENDPSALLTEDYEKYYQHMAMLMFFAENKAKNEIANMDTLLFANNGNRPALHWETLLNYNAKINYYKLTDASMEKFASKFILPSMQIALLRNSIKYNCVYEMMIFLIAYDLPFTSYMLTTTNGIDFIGTILPKILFYKTAMNYIYFPEITTSIMPISLDTKKLIDANHPFAAESDPYNGNCYKFLINEKVKKELKQKGVPDEDLSFILISFRKELERMITGFPYKITTTQNWQDIYLCIKDIISVNCAVPYYNTVSPGLNEKDTNAKSKNLFRLSNNTLCKIPDDVLDSHRMLAHNFAVDKIYYTHTKVENNIQEFINLL